TLFRAVSGRGDRGVGVHRLGGDDAEVATRDLAGVGRRAHRAADLAGAGQPEAVAVDRLDVVAREVVGPDLDVVEGAEVRGEQRPDSAAADDADPHQEPSFALIRRYRVVCSGTGTPCRLPSRTSEPVISSISVG